MPSLLKVFASDNFSNTIGQTSLNNFSNTIGQTSLNNFSNTIGQTSLNNFSNTIGQTSLNNVYKGPCSVLPIISLSDLIVMQSHVENIGKSKTWKKHLVFHLIFNLFDLFVSIYSEFLFHIDI